MEVIIMDKNEELENISEVVKDSPIDNPEMTFCEKTTYLEFLLSNAKDEEEAEQIKATINDYLDLYNAHDDSFEETEEDSDEEETTED
jgi:hypothetical protein